MNQPKDQNKGQFRDAITFTVLWVAGLTLVVIFLALFAGIMLDKVFNSKPILTIILTVTSIPVTLFLTFRIVKKATSRLQKPVKPQTPDEEDFDSGEKD